MAAELVYLIRRGLDQRRQPVLARLTQRGGDHIGQHRGHRGNRRADLLAHGAHDLKQQVAHPATLRNGAALVWSARASSAAPRAPELSPCRATRISGGRA